MDNVRQWAFGICAASIACALAQMLLPSSSLQKTFQMTCSVFFLSCLLSPVLFAPWTIDSAQLVDFQSQVTEKAEHLEETLREDTIYLAEENLKNRLEEILLEQEIIARKISVQAHDVGDGRISITECEIQLEEKDADRCTLLQTYLQERLEMEVKVICEQTDG